jgi:hypothetical protein
VQKCLVIEEANPLFWGGATLALPQDHKSPLENPSKILPFDLSQDGPKSFLQIRLNIDNPVMLQRICITSQTAQTSGQGYTTVNSEGVS